MRTKPLRDRKLDWFFILMFSVFALTSFVVDTFTILHELISGGEGEWFVTRILMETYADCDPLFVQNPPFLQVAVGISAFVWGPLYVFLVWGFVRGRNVIRIPALMYSSTLTAIMLMIFAEELYSTVPGWATQMPGKFLQYNLPYLIVPILVGIRMARPHPFGREDE